MKKLLSLLLLTGFVVLFGCTKTGLAPTETSSGSTTSAITGDKQNIPERQTYESKTSGFSLQFPATWTFQEKVFDSAVMFFSPISEEDKIKENIGINIKTLDRTYTLDEYYTTHKSKIITLIPGFTEVSSGSLKVNDIDAIKIIYTGVQGATQLKFEQVYLIKNNTIYIITYTATQASFDEYSQKVDEMIATLEIK